MEQHSGGCGSLTLRMENRSHELRLVDRKARKQILPKNLQREHCPADIFMPAHWDPGQTSNPHNWKMRNLCCFKPLRVWKFIIAALANSFTSCLCISQRNTHKHLLTQSELYIFSPKWHIRCRGEKNCKAEKEKNAEISLIMNIYSDLAHLGTFVHL